MTVQSQSAVVPKSKAASAPRAPLHFLGLACAIGVSTIYFNQPLLLEIGRTYGSTAVQVGLVTGATQVGYALGLLLFLITFTVIAVAQAMLRRLERRAGVPI